MNQINEHVEKLKQAFATLPTGPFFSRKIDDDTWETVALPTDKDVVEVCRHGRAYWPAMEILLNNIPWFFRIIDDFPNMELRALQLQARVKELEDAIKDHRGYTTVFCPTDITHFDEELWELVPVTPDDHVRSLNEKEIAILNDNRINVITDDPVSGGSEDVQRKIDLGEGCSGAGGEAPYPNNWGCI